MRDDGEMWTDLVLLIPAASDKEEVARQRPVRPSGERKKKRRKGMFADSPLGFPVITNTFKTETLGILLGNLRSSKNIGKNYIGY